MAYRRTVLFALLAASALTPILFAQNRQQTPAPQAPPAKAQPFDPHDISGIWRNPGGFDPIIGMNRPPMTEWGKEKWSKTRASARNTPLAFGFYQDQKDWNDPLFLCDPSGYPRTLDYSNYRFVKLPDEFVMFFERDRVWRDLWTDGRKLPGPEAKPRWYGYATAHWEGDTLVVESSGYDERSWIDPYGSIHSDQMRIEERFRRLDHEGRHTGTCEKNIVSILLSALSGKDGPWMALAELVGTRSKRTNVYELPSGGLLSGDAPLNVPLPEETIAAAVS